MSLRILMVGHDQKGAWEMRGRQLGRAIGAKVSANPSASDWSWAQMVVLVKRASARWGEKAASLGVPVVWDVLDCWDQPEANHLSEMEHVQFIAQQQRASGASLLIGATEDMATAIGGVYLSHHCWRGLRPTPIRARAKVVAYDGSARYLGVWREAIERACARLGMTFDINPVSVAEADVLVAFRDGRWDGWACRHWKSGIKYVNAIVAGRPILTQATAAFDELKPEGAIVERPEDITDALAAFSSSEARLPAFEMGLKRAADFTVEAIASRYKGLLQTVPARAA